ncbi:hypothetical protein [Streptomyces sp. NPDC051219]|uniref:hypothetical protein n=1 Tax=Streptomyces sp. NPDC051219 TaxID=3155283 RepID=UPI00341DD8AA
MTRRYPITQHRELQPSFRWSAFRQRRRPLVAASDEILVHRIGADYVAGTVDATTAAQATAVSAVNVRRNVTVVVQRNLESADAEWDFPVAVTFHCTVVDPVAVVRARRTAAILTMNSFLAQAPRLGGVCEAYGPGDEERLRRDLASLLKLRPTHTSIPGVKAVVAGIDVGRARYLGSEA